MTQTSVNVTEYTVLVILLSFFRKQKTGKFEGLICIKNKLFLQIRKH